MVVLAGLFNARLAGVFSPSAAGLSLDRVLGPDSLLTDVYEQKNAGASNFSTLNFICFRCYKKILMLL